MMQRNVCRIDSTRYGIMRMCATDSIAIYSIDDDDVDVYNTEPRSRRWISLQCRHT